MAGVVSTGVSAGIRGHHPAIWDSGQKYTTEFIGAFFLTFAVAMAALSGSVFVPLAAGATLMVMIYAGGHISGGHYNPAVTMAALVRRRIGISDAIPYWIVQAVAGIAAGALARALVNPATVRTLTLSGHTEAAAAVVEVLITFALCYVVLNVATSKDQRTTGSSAWRSASPSRPARSLSAASPAGCSTRPSRSAAPPRACSPGRRSGSTSSSNSPRAWLQAWRSWRSTPATSDRHGQPPPVPAGACLLRPAR